MGCKGVVNILLHPYIYLYRRTDLIPFILPILPLFYQFVLFFPSFFHIIHAWGWVDGVFLVNFSVKEGGIFFF